MRHEFIIFGLLLAGCGGGGGQSSPYPGRISPDISWTTYGTSGGIIARLPNPFNFPPRGQSINYVYTAPQGLAVGKIVTLDYTIIGDGIFGVADSSDQPPATVRLFIWGNQADTGNDRWWCPKPVDLGVGEFSLSCTIDQTWTGVMGQAANQMFTAAVGNPFAVGFTFGGAFFAGHGVYANGSDSFKINSYTVQ